MKALEPKPCQGSSWLDPRLGSCKPYRWRTAAPTLKLQISYVHAPIPKTRRSKIHATLQNAFRDIRYITCREIRIKLFDNFAWNFHSGPNIIINHDSFCTILGFTDLGINEVHYFLSLVHQYRSFGSLNWGFNIRVFYSTFRASVKKFHLGAGIDRYFTGYFNNFAVNFSNYFTAEMVNIYHRCASE